MQLKNLSWKWISKTSNITLSCNISGKIDVAYFGKQLPQNYQNVIDKHKEANLMTLNFTRSRKHSLVVGLDYSLTRQ